MSSREYRDNVCAVIRRKSDNSVLICHRKGFPENKGWQFPQGGIDIRKNLIDELKRELLEEIGTANVSIISVSPHTYQYDFPAGINSKHQQYCGQKQKWVLTELHADDCAIHIDSVKAEFDAYQWVTPQEALSRVVNFKKDVYRRALKDLGLM